MFILFLLLFLFLHVNLKFICTTWVWLIPILIIDFLYNTILFHATSLQMTWFTDWMLLLQNTLLRNAAFISFIWTFEVSTLCINWHQVILLDWFFYDWSWLFVGEWLLLWFVFSHASTAHASWAFNHILIDSFSFNGFLIILLKRFCVNILFNIRWWLLNNLFLLLLFVLLSILSYWWFDHWGYNLWCMLAGIYLYKWKRIFITSFSEEILLLRNLLNLWSWFASEWFW